MTQRSAKPIATQNMRNENEQFGFIQLTVSQLFFDGTVITSRRITSVARLGRVRTGALGLEHSTIGLVWLRR
jgi:hypothetical protein